MEILMEILGELGGFFLEDGIERAADRKLPKYLRVFILAGTALTFAAVFAFILAIGIQSLRETPLLTVLMFALDAGLVCLCVYQVWKVLRTGSRQ